MQNKSKKHVINMDKLCKNMQEICKKYAENAEYAKKYVNNI